MSDFYVNANQKHDKNNKRLSKTSQLILTAIYYNIQQWHCTLRKDFVIYTCIWGVV